MAQKEFLRHLWYQKVVLLKPGDRARGQKELPRGQKDWPMIDFHVGRGLGIASVSGNFGSKVSRALGY